MSEAIETKRQENPLPILMSSSAPSGWKEALLTALPFLWISLSGLVTLSYGLGWLQYETKLSGVISTIFAVAVALTGIGLLVYAWRKGWPRWSASWMVLWLIGLIALSTGLPTSLWKPGQLFYEYLQPFLWGSIILLIAYLLYRVFRQDAIKGLLAALPLMGIIWLPLSESVPDDLEGVITLSTWLLLAVGAVIVLRAKSFALALGVTLGVIAIHGLPYAYEGIYHGGYLNYAAPGPSFQQVLRCYLPYLVSASILVIGPSFGRFYFYLGLGSGPPGRRLYRLVLLGILLMLIANILTNIVQTSDALQAVWRSSRLILNLLNWLGALIFFTGFVWLGIVARRQQALPSTGLMVLLFILSLLLPGMLLMTLHYGFRWPVQVPFYDIGYLYSYPEFPVYGYGLVWMALSAWLVVRLNMKISPGQVY